MAENQEILFAKTLEKVRRLAGEQKNCIREGQVREAFESLSLSEEQLLLVFDYLKKHRITVGEPERQDGKSAEGFTEKEEISRDEAPLKGSEDYLEEYKNSITLEENISDGEREAIILSAMAGEQEAQHRLIGLYLPQVLEVSRLYEGQGVYPEDLIGEGNLALSVGVTMLGCLENAREAEGMLMKMIMDAMEDAIAENLRERDGDRKVAERVNQVAEKARELADELRRKVTVEELSGETGMSRKDIEDAMRMSGFAIEELERQRADI